MRLFQIPFSHNCIKGPAGRPASH